MYQKWRYAFHELTDRGNILFSITSVLGLTVTVLILVCLGGLITGTYRYWDKQLKDMESIVDLGPNKDIEEARNVFMFNMGDFKKPAKLIGKLKNAKQRDDPVSFYLKKKLSPKFRRQIEEELDISKEFLSRFVAEFNHLLETPVYDIERFTKVKLSKETQELLANKEIEKDGLIKLNMLLLEDAYPDEIRKRERSNLIRKIDTYLIDQYDFVTNDGDFYLTSTQGYAVEVPFLRSSSALSIGIPALNDIEENCVQFLNRQELGTDYDECGIVMPLGLLKKLGYIVSEKPYRYIETIEIGNQRFKMKETITVDGHDRCLYFVLIYSNRSLVRVPVVAVISDFRKSDTAFISQDTWFLLKKWNPEYASQMRTWSHTEIILSLARPGLHDTLQQWVARNHIQDELSKKGLFLASSQPNQNTASFYSFHRYQNRQELHTFFTRWNDIAVKEIKIQYHTRQWNIEQNISYLKIKVPDLATGNIIKKELGTGVWEYWGSVLLIQEIYAGCKTWQDVIQDIRRRFPQIAAGIQPILEEPENAPFYKLREPIDTLFAYVFVKDKQRIVEVMDILKVRGFICSSKIQDFVDMIDKTSQMLNKFAWGLVILFVCLSVVILSNAMYSMVLRKTAEVGILKAIGSTNRLVFYLYFLEAFYIGIVAYIIGNIAGIGVGHLLAGKTAEVLRIRTETSLFYFDPWLMMPAIGAVTLFCVFFGVFFPALKASRQQPIRAIQEGRE